MIIIRCAAKSLEALIFCTELIAMRDLTWLANSVYGIVRGDRIISFLTTGNSR
ncbi:MAG: hypothetical protein LH649_03815 [Pseudanabaena sp. CAN_BIN31]|nr:hypothetical protein [Pseudanabaena sp. CAN_BIN31]